ncbi:MAG: hypothetical protein KAQ92_08070 [Candidatus Aenigmarchaeota archaeon]|nr:hypothetical protein [Candidatus Aenigmarchaeota archaeon]
MICIETKKLCVGISTKYNNLKKLLKTPEAKYISEVFVSAPKTIGINTGRKNTGIMTNELLEKMIALAHKNNIKINVLANSLFLNGKGFEKAFQNNFKKEFRKIAKAGVDMITLSNSKTIELASNEKKVYDYKIKIAVSSFNQVNTPLLAEEYGALGADRIIFHQKENRNIPMIKRIIEYNPDLEFEIYMNSKCINGGQCPNTDLHSEYHSITADMKSTWEKDPLLVACSARRNKNPIDRLFTSTIRPEDMYLYRDIGFKYFKIATRTDSFEKRIELIKAYGEEKYNGYFGNLWNNTSVDASTIPNRALDNLMDKIKDYAIEDQKVVYEEIKEIWQNNINDEEKIISSVQEYIKKI